MNKKSQPRSPISVWLRVQKGCVVLRIALPTRWFTVLVALAAGLLVNPAQLAQVLQAVLAWLK
jgi:hypothetical protein